MNITEDYCSFEVAKLLKEKGFDDEYTNAFYDKTGNLYFIDLLSDFSEHPNNDTDIAASTLYVAMKWLREAYNECIVVQPIITDDDGSARCLWEFTISKRLKIQYNSECIYELYEVACEAAIKYCLTNLIK